jgi:hypothetical protein
VSDCSSASHSPLTRKQRLYGRGSLSRCRLSGLQTGRLVVGVRVAERKVRLDRECRYLP